MRSKLVQFGLTEWFDKKLRLAVQFILHQTDNFVTP